MVIETERLLLREFTHEDFQHYLKLFQTQKPCDTIPNLLMRTVQRIGLNGIFKIIKSTDLDCGPSF